MSPGAITACVCWGAFCGWVLYCALKPEQPASVPTAQPEPFIFDERELDEIEALEELFALPAVEARR